MQAKIKPREAAYGSLEAHKKATEAACRQSGGGKPTGDAWRDGFDPAPKLANI